MLERLFLLVQQQQTVQRQVQKLLRLLKQQDHLRLLKQQDQEQKSRLWTRVA